MPSAPGALPFVILLMALLISRTDGGSVFMVTCCVAARIGAVFFKFWLAKDTVQTVLQSSKLSSTQNKTLPSYLSGANAPICDCLWVWYTASLRLAVP